MHPAPGTFHWHHPVRPMLDWLRRWFAPLPLGKRGEREAAKFLRRKGYRIVAAGDRGPTGELDLIAVDGRTIVFVEVKTRVTHRAGHPAEAVDDAKQQRLVRAALAFLKRHRLLDCSARFDVIAVTWSDPKTPPLIEHIPNAFQPSGQGQWFA